MSLDSIPALCVNDAAYQVTQATEKNGLAGNWLFKGAVISASGTINPALKIGASELTAIYDATNGCRDSAIGRVMIYPIPSVNAGPDLYMVEGGNVFFESEAGGYSTVRWTPSSYLLNPTGLSTYASPPASMQYVLTAFGIGRCQARDTVGVIVLKHPNIPSAFSPNGDGINDIWNIRYLDTYPGCTVDVFDRYGRQVYHTSGYAKPWDGNLNGRPMPLGVYYFVINTKKHQRPFTGSVTLVR